MDSCFQPLTKESICDDNEPRFSFREVGFCVFDEILLNKSFREKEERDGRRTKSISYSDKKEYVVERWWHRLLRVIKYITTLIIIFGALFFVIDEAQYYTYSYSFEPDYAESKGKELNCNTYDYIDSLDCGGLNTGEEFMAKYIASAKSKAIPDPWAVVKTEPMEEKKTGDRFGGIPVEEKNPFGDTVFGEGHSDRKRAEFIIQKDQIKYKRQYNFNANKLTSGLGVILLIAITWYIAILVLYKIILYIVHGHTRVRKPTPNP